MLCFNTKQALLPCVVVGVPVDSIVCEPISDQAQLSRNAMNDFSGLMLNRGV